MKMVVLDGYALNPGDNPWDEIEALGELTVYDRSPSDTVLERCAGADIVFTNKTVLDRKTIESLPDLKMISVLATGFNIVDIRAAAERGIPVCNVPAYSTDSVAELVLTFILEFCRRIELHSESVKRMEWCSCPDYTYQLTPQTELKGKTLGIIGFGRIGQRVAEMASVFGMNILVNTPHPRNLSKDSKVVFVSQRELAERSDFISLNCPLKPENSGMINRDFIAHMKKTAVLINTARGQLVDEAALAEALNTSQIGGAALDVLSTEPPAADNPLLSAKNCIITPHVAWGTYEARLRLMHISAENVLSFRNGNVINRVN